MAKEHHFASHLVWTGAAQGPTSSYEAYSRAYQAKVEGKPPLEGSSDPAFRGDPSRYNPEDLLVVSLSACHMLSYLYVLLAPKVTIARGDREKAIALHEQAHEQCFIANSVNFPVRHEPVVEHRG